MFALTRFPTIAAAYLALKREGYVGFECYSSVGDMEYGSREYWFRPEAPKNEFGISTDRCCISMDFDGSWTTFDLPGANETGPFPIAA